ncbi:MAG: hypothetical protein ACYDHM_10190 [Acidiferrobacterales bacterium]
MGKNSWGWGRRVIDVGPIEDEFLQWMGSPEGLLSQEALEIVWPLLDTTRIDVQGEKLIWPDGKRLGIEQTVQRIHQDHPALDRDAIEDKVISWLEMEYVPKDYTPEQMDEFEERIDLWLERHQRRARRL